MKNSIFAMSILAGVLGAAVGARAQPAPGSLSTTECTKKKAELSAIIKSHLGKKVDVVACRAGRFPEPGWAVVFWSVGNGNDDADHAVLHVQVLLGNGAQQLAVFSESGAPSFPAKLTVGGLEVVDLDGDGTDEILRYDLWPTNKKLTALAIEGSRISQSFSFQYAYDDSASTEYGFIKCDATIRIAAADAEGQRFVVVDGRLIHGNIAAAEKAGCIIGHQHYGESSGWVRLRSR